MKGGSVLEQCYKTAQNLSKFCWDNSYYTPGYPLVNLEPQMGKPQGPQKSQSDSFQVNFDTNQSQNQFDLSLGKGTNKKKRNRGADKGSNFIPSYNDCKGNQKANQGGGNSSNFKGGDGKNKNSVASKT